LAGIGTAVVAGLVLGSVALVGAASAAPSNAVAQAGPGGRRLSPVQVQTLRNAFAHNPRLTRAQAQRLIGGGGAVGAVTPAIQGHASSSGNCGTADLSGNSFGAWLAHLAFHTEIVGTAAIGGATVSTNAVFGADSKSFGVSGAVVAKSDHTMGLLNPIGWGASGTTFDGWALTTGAWFCWWDLVAIWH
jgi:hypothetical protein